jgi:hypothetical protein
MRDKVVGLDLHKKETEEKMQNPLISKPIKTAKTKLLKRANLEIKLLTLLTTAQAHIKAPTTTQDQ